MLHIRQKYPESNQMCFFFRSIQCATPVERSCQRQDWKGSKSPTFQFRWEGFLLSEWRVGNACDLHSISWSTPKNCPNVRIRPSPLCIIGWKSSAKQAKPPIVEHVSKQLSRFLFCFVCHMKTWPIAGNFQGLTVCNTILSCLSSFYSCANNHEFGLCLGVLWPANPPKEKGYRSYELTRATGTVKGVWCCFYLGINENRN